jgi:hypothetical protein
MAMKTDINLSKEEFQKALAGFTGTEMYHLHRSFNGMTLKLTDGCHFVREHAGDGAYWLFDLILSWQVRLARHKFQAWELIRQEDATWTISCSDGNGNHLASQRILYSDFPIERFTLWMIDGVALLPSEY